MRPSAARARAFLDWETDGAADAGWSELFALGQAGFPRTKVVTGPRPKATRLRALSIPTLVLLAGRSRAHDAERVAAAVTRVIPRAAAVVLPGVSHHAVPMAEAARLNELLTGFLRQP